MGDLESAIAKVELEIRHAESKAEAAYIAGKPEERSYWRTKEIRLRHKKHQLREEKVLIMRASGLQAPAPSYQTCSHFQQSGSGSFWHECLPVTLLMAVSTWENCWQHLASCAASHII